MKKEQLFTSIEEIKAHFLPEGFKLEKENKPNELSLPQSLLNKIKAEVSRK